MIGVYATKNVKIALVHILAVKASQKSPKW